jgi:membrane protein
VTAKPGIFAILLRIKDDLSRKNLQFIAAGAAFYGFLAIPATIAVVVSLCGLLLDPSHMQRLVGAVGEVLPFDAEKLLSDPHSRQTLGIGLLIGLAVDVWSFISGGSSMVTAFNLASGATETRSFIKRQIIVVTLAAEMVLFALLTIALVAVMPAILDRLPIGEFGKSVISMIRWAVLGAVLLVLLPSIYRVAPCRAARPRRWLSWGAVAAALVWALGSAGFSYYVNSWASYDESYGALGAVMLLLMWLYLFAFVVLLGARIDVEIDAHNRMTQQARDEEPYSGRF